MAGSYRKARLNDTPFRRLVLLAVLGFILLVTLIYKYSPGTDQNPNPPHNIHTLGLKNFNLLKQNELSASLRIRNLMPPRNSDLYPNLAKDRIVIVLYVHNRPQYLQVAINSLSEVEGINETLLIVSHDGYFEQMNKIVESIDFCQVKQIFAPFSPHIFPNSFPGFSPSDCKDEDGPAKTNCEGTKDQYGNYRSPKIVSLKHHWWWMMNMVWDGLRETRFLTGHIVFIEEDHFIYPNAYRNLQLLVKLKPEKCPNCYAVNLAPSDVLSRGEGWDVLVAEKIGNVGYAFNRTVWRKIHEKADEFCMFDEYNWDITMWARVYPSFGARCMLTIFTLFATKTEASLLRMLKGSPDVYLSGPIKKYIMDRGGRFHLRWGCREVLYNRSSDGSVYVTGLVMSKATQKKIVSADAYVAACDVPGIKRLLPQQWRDLDFFDNIHKLVGVPVVTVQLRYNGWVTELKDLERARQLRRAEGLDNLLYTPDADFSCFADLALASPEDYYLEGQGSLLQCVLTPGDPYMPLPNDEIVKRVSKQVVDLFPSSQDLTVIWSSVVKIGQSLYREGPGKDPFRPDQKTPVTNFFLAGSYTKQDYIDSMEGATLSGRHASAYICDTGEDLAALRKSLPSDQLTLV